MLIFYITAQDYLLIHEGHSLADLQINNKKLSIIYLKNQFIIIFFFLLGEDDAYS